MNIDLPGSNSREIVGDAAFLVGSRDGQEGEQLRLIFRPHALTAFWGRGIEGVQLFSGLEANRLAGCDADFGSGSGVAAYAGFTGTDAEDAETAQFNAVAGSQGILEALEDRIHSSLSLGSRQACPFDDVMDNILLDQNRSPLVEEFFCACA